MTQETDDDAFLDRLIEDSLAMILDGSYGQFSLPSFEDGRPYLEQGGYLADGGPSPSKIQWICNQLCTHVGTLGITHLHIFLPWLETGEMVKDMAQFIHNSPSLSSVDLEGSAGDNTDILVLAAAKNKGIKKVTASPKEVSTLITLLDAQHVETLDLECEVSDNEKVADALLMSPRLSYVSLLNGPFAIRVLEKLSHGGKTKMKSLTVTVAILSNDYCQATVDSLVNCVTSPPANVQTLKLRTIEPGQSGVFLPDMDFRIEPGNMDSQTIVHLACNCLQDNDRLQNYPVDLLGVDAQDDNWLGTVMSMPELEHLKLYSPFNLHDTDIDSLSDALSLQSIGFSFTENFIIDPSIVYSTIGYLVAKGSLKQATFDELVIDHQVWANLCEFVISSAPALKKVNLNISIYQQEGALQDGNADGSPATIEKMPRALKNPSWNMSKSLLAEFFWSLHSLGPNQFSCNVMFSDEASVHSITCDADFDQPSWQRFCKMLAGSSCMIERVELGRPQHLSYNDATLHACTGEPLWAALDSNSSLKYCNLDNQNAICCNIYNQKRDWNDRIMYYTTRNKLDDLFSGDETSTMKLWVPAVEAVRKQYHGNSLIFHLVQAKPLLFVREEERKKKT